MLNEWGERERTFNCYVDATRTLTCNWLTLQHHECIRTPHPVLPLFEEVYHSFEVINAILSLHVHQDAVWSRLHRNMKEGIDAWMIQYLGHLLMRHREESGRKKRDWETRNKGLEFSYVFFIRMAIGMKSLKCRSVSSFYLLCIGLGLKCCCLSVCLK